MKRSALILLLALSLAACVKETPGADAVRQTAGQVSFSPLLCAPVTKTVYNEYLDEIGGEHYGFGVYGFVKGDNTYTGGFMTNETIKLTDGSWQASKDFFWPKVSRVAFFAYSPRYYDDKYPLRRTASYDSANKRFVHNLEGIVINDNNLSTGFKDLLYSDIALNFNNYADGVSNMISTGGTDYTGIPILFRHAFCKVTFKARLSKTTGDDLGEQELPPILRGEVRTTVSDTDTEESVTTVAGTKADIGDIDIKTTVTLHTRVENVTQEVVSTTISGRRTWSGSITAFTVSALFKKANLRLRSPRLDSYFGTDNAIVQWDTEASYWEAVNRDKSLSMGASPVAIDGSARNLKDQDVLIPQKEFKNDQVVHIEYSVTTTPENTSRTTRKDSWTVTSYMKRTKVQVFRHGTTELVDDERNGETEETISQVVSAKILGTPSAPDSGGGNTTLSFSRDFPLNGLGGLTSWGLGEQITYTFVIEPTSGMRINWDPAQVSTWETGTNGNINL